MATKQRNRSRRTPRNYTPRYVAPVLDPNWKSPYAPSAHERAANERAVRTFALRRRATQAVIVGVISLALVVGVVVAAWLPVLGVVLAALFVYDTMRSVKKTNASGGTLGGQFLAAFTPGGTSAQRQRLVTVLDRLAATFGITDISAFIVRDSTYNAALVPDGAKYALFVTSALMDDFELIELEGVVAHCIVRARLGLLEREAVASVSTISDAQRARLAGIGETYRCDEVAAAGIRYPLGLATALRRCARQTPDGNSFFSSSTYKQWRWVFFNVWSDRVGPVEGDLDDATLRAMALEEW